MFFSFIFCLSYFLCFTVYVSMPVCMSACPSFFLFFSFFLCFSSFVFFLTFSFYVYLSACPPLFTVLSVFFFNFLNFFLLFFFFYFHSNLLLLPLLWLTLSSPALPFSFFHAWPHNHYTSLISSNICSSHPPVANRHSLSRVCFCKQTWLYTICLPYSTSLRLMWKPIHLISASILFLAHLLLQVWS